MLLSENLIRTFISIEIDEDTKKEIAKYCKRLNYIKGIKWVEPYNYHLTLNFLGEIPEIIIPKLIKILDKVSLKYSSFKIELGDMGFFPNSKKPRVLWVDIKNPEQVINIKKELDELLKNSNISFDEKSFKPHLTLGRFKEDSKQIFLPEDLKFEISFIVNSINLMKSTLSRQGPQYTVIHSSFFKNNSI